jgi:hypothetical protein
MFFVMMVIMFEKMGRLTGVEPATTRITTEGSTTELQSP